MSHVNKTWFAADEDSDAERKDANRQTASLGGMVVALFLVVIGLFLIKQLHAKVVMEDCLMSGQSNCTQPIRL